MICPLCKTENLSGDDTCIECGSSLTAEEFQIGANQTKNHIREITDSISQIGFRKSIAVSPNTKMREVIFKMKTEETGCVLVVENKEVVGIFTERDILHKLAKPGMDLEELEMKDFMTPSPEVLLESDSISYALNKMAMGSYRHVPVLRASGDFSVLSVRDILRHFF